MDKPKKNLSGMLITFIGLGLVLLNKSGLFTLFGEGGEIFGSILSILGIILFIIGLIRWNSEIKRKKKIKEDTK